MLGAVDDRNFTLPGLEKVDGIKQQRRLVVAEVMTQGEKGEGGFRGQRATNPLGDRVTEFLVDELIRARNRGPQPTEDRNIKFQKINALNPPRFTREGGPTLLEEWIRDFKKLFVVVHCPENRWVNYAIYYLRGEADAWWHIVENRAQTPRFNWAGFTQLLRNRYYPE
ncbi:hypothetical protein Droror1_Dr00018191 [Drosera rotundifolia]